MIVKLEVYKNTSENILLSEMTLFVAFVKLTLSICCLWITEQMSIVSSSSICFQKGLYLARVSGALIFVWLFAFVFGAVCSLSAQDKGVQAVTLFAILMCLSSMPIHLKGLCVTLFRVKFPKVFQRLYRGVSVALVQYTVIS